MVVIARYDDPNILNYNYCLQQTGLSSIYVTKSFVYFVHVNEAFVYLYTRIQKCDMIKGNESDVANIEFELSAKRGDKF